MELELQSLREAKFRGVSDNRVAGWGLAGVSGNSRFWVVGLQSGAFAKRSLGAWFCPGCLVFSLDVQAPLFYTEEVVAQCPVKERGSLFPKLRSESLCISRKTVLFTTWRSRPEWHSTMAASPAGSPERPMPGRFPTLSSSFSPQKTMGIQHRSTWDFAYLGS